MNLSPLSVAVLNPWVAIYPEIGLGLLALALLMLEVFLPKRFVGILPRLAIWGQVLIVVLVLVDFRSPWLGRETFSGLLLHTSTGQYMRLFFLLASVLVCFLATISLARRNVPRVEFLHLVIVATAAMMLLAQSNHFLMLFIALETVSVCFFILVSYFRHSAHSLEAGLKYLVLGALSSALLLFGIVLLYGAASNPLLPGATPEPMNFLALRSFLEVNPDNYLANIGMALVLAGIAFKIGVVPFQIWIPDVYQGAPTPVTAFLAVASKSAGFAVLLILLDRAFMPLLPLAIPLLGTIAVVSIIFGNLAALQQRNTKRLMGLSGISHAGYLLVGVMATAYVPWAAGAVYFYLLTYLLGAMSVFAVMAYLGKDNDAEQELDDFSNLAKQRPLLGAVLAVGLASLAGVPPLAGFIGKLLIFVAAFQAGLYVPLAIAVAGVVVSIYYYFGWIRAAYFPAPAVLDESQEGTAPLRVGITVLGGSTLVVLALATVFLGFFQGPLSQWIAAW